MDLRDGLGIKAVRVWLPERADTAHEAVADGRIDPEEQATAGIRQLPVSDLAAPEMAVRAARAALAAAGPDAPAPDLLIHAWIHHQGHDFWSPAHYVARELGAHHTLPVGIQQMCNGGAVGLELAAARLLADPGCRSALVTTADRFADEGFDRWRGDYGVWYGDAATAVVLHRPDGSPDELLLRSLATATIPEVEALHRGRDAFSPAPRWHSDRVDVRRTKKAFIEDTGLDVFYRRVHSVLPDIVLGALADAGLEPDDPRVTLIAFPRVGDKVLNETYYPGVAGLTKARNIRLGGDTGHLGAGDMAANFEEIRRRGLLDAGEIALVISAGGGFTFSCAAVEMQQ
ncbi:3-oxoacyl-ACP synthase [Streptomyces sp. NPDC001502]|uniref:3-oxoacyl-ACP synthase n=1 Tax=Streptomyces sp. NPDC001502 TaxID=3364578 RepID=UPI0036CF4693